MKWWIILIEIIVMLVLFSCMTLIPLLKNPVSYIHDYPKEIQDEYFKTHEKIETAPFSKRVILIKSVAILVFAAIFVFAAWLAGADSFLEGFLFSLAVFFVVGAYDTFFLDWVLFAKVKRFRLPGTEHMDREYAQKWFHLKGMLFPGSLFAVVLAVIVGLAIMLVA